MNVKKLKAFKDKRGVLVPMEFDAFKAKRIFWVTGVPENTARGNHAHKKTQQILICIKGKIKVDLRTMKGEKKSLTLNENEYVFVDRKIYDTQTFSSKNDILLVLANTLYDQNDYIYE